MSGAAAFGHIPSRDRPAQPNIGDDQPDARMFGKVLGHRLAAGELENLPARLLERIGHFHAYEPLVLDEEGDFRRGGCACAQRGLFAVRVLPATNTTIRVVLGR